MKSKVLLTCVIMVMALMLSAGALFVTKDERKQFLEHRAALVMREIGHKILLHSGDSTSLVLPVKRMSESIFQIEFQSQFSFVPDTLVKVVHKSLASSDLPLKYSVNVQNCLSNEIIYGYEINAVKKDNIACLGRNQPFGCYTIQIAFTDWEPSRSAMNSRYLLIIALASVAGLTFVGRAYSNKQKKPVVVLEENLIRIGTYTFCPHKRELKNEKGVIGLSDKESKLLILFATHQNELIDRDQLLKEVWENEGVFVGRSLDVFVSKLRKKLQGDPSIRLTNIHGKGYTLEVD